MGCCNKVHLDNPISWFRYLVGLCFFVVVQAVVMAGLAAGSLVSARCRNVRGFHRAWAMDRIRSILRPEGFRVGGARSACAGPGSEGGGT